MKIQNGFISSSSSVTVEYSTSLANSWTTTTAAGFLANSGYEKLLSKSITERNGAEWSTYSDLKNTTSYQEVIWKTYKSSSYQRIEYFLNAVEKLNSAYTRNGVKSIPFYNYAYTAASKFLYNGFVDVVITFPCKIRLAGIELLNPWNNKLTTDAEYYYWKYLPKTISIFKVNDEEKNANGDSLTYEHDIMKSTDEFNKQTLRPILWEDIDKDSKMTFLGRYDINWENISSYKCFFKFNESDKVSISTKSNEFDTGTATWECKQIVIRIFKAYEDNSYEYLYKRIGDLGTIPVGIDMDRYYDSYIFKNICEHILDRELDYGTTIDNRSPTIDDMVGEYGFYNIYLTSRRRIDFK